MRILRYLSRSNKLARKSDVEFLDLAGEEEGDLPRLLARWLRNRHQEKRTLWSCRLLVGWVGTLLRRIRLPDDACEGRLPRPLALLFHLRLLHNFHLDWPVLDNRIRRGRLVGPHKIQKFCPTKKILLTQHCRNQDDRSQ